MGDSPALRAKDDDVSASESDDEPAEPEDPEVREKIRKEKRDLWESTLPKKLIKGISGPADPSYTFIESDETPTLTYEKRFLAAKNKKATGTRRLPFCS